MIRPPHRSKPTDPLCPSTMLFLSLAKNALHPPRQGALACARGAGRLGQREPLREPTSGPALEALHHRVGMRKVVGNHELGLRTACLDQQIACHQGRQRRTAPSDDAQGQVDVDQSGTRGGERSEEHTSELQSLMRISYAVFCLKKNKKQTRAHPNTTDKT